MCVYIYKSHMLNPTCFFGVLLFLLRNLCIRFILIATRSFSLFTFSAMWIYCNLPAYPIVGLFGLFSVWEYHDNVLMNISAHVRLTLSPHIFRVYSWEGNCWGWNVYLHIQQITPNYLLKCLYQLTIWLVMCKTSFHSPSYPRLILTHRLIFTSLVCNSLSLLFKSSLPLITNKLSHILMCLLAIWISIIWFSDFKTTGE